MGLDQRQGIVKLGAGIREQCREVGRHKPCGGNSMGGERQCRRPPVRLELFVVDDDTGQMNDGRMDDKFTGIVWAQLTANGLLDLHRHPPGPDEFSSDFYEVAPDAGLFHLGQGGFKVAGFDKRGLSSPRDGLVEHEVADDRATTLR